MIKQRTVQTSLSQTMIGEGGMKPFVVGENTNNGGKSVNRLKIPRLDEK